MRSTRDDPSTQEHGRERRKRVTRQSLRRATLELGLERGLAAVSVEAIAARAEVSPRTFFNYFDTKEDAALLPLFTMTDAELAASAEGPAEDTWAAPARIFAADADGAAEDAADLHQFFALQQQNPVLAGRQLAVFSRFEARISAAATARLGGGPEAQLRGPLLVGCCITAVRVALNRWVSTDRREPLRSHVEQALALVEPARA